MNSNPVTREELAKALGNLSQRVLVLEQTATTPSLLISDKQPNPSRAREEASLAQHPAGLCQDESCEVCVAQANQIAQAVMGQAQDEAISQGRRAALTEITTALNWAGGEALAGQVTSVVQQWKARGRPAPEATPALVITE